MFCALILAGGKGERFWPLSTGDKPKQFLKLLGKDTMIQMTVKRLEELIPLNRIFVVTAKNYVNIVKEQLPTLPQENIIVEPVGRNTAPCIALSAFYISKRVENAIIAVLPSDHLIKNEKKFREVLESAYEFVERCENAIVTLGVKPDRPETEYGYIKKSYEVAKINDNYIYKVEKFVEKPSRDIAEKYLQDDAYFWNSGVFIWKLSTILECTKYYLPNTFEILAKIADSEEEFGEVLLQKYKEVDNISIDYGIMEKADNIYMIPCDFGWDDLGSWASIERYKDKDLNENVEMPNVFFHESRGNIVFSNKKVILNNVNNLLIIETDQFIIISDKDHCKEIKSLKNIISGGW